jgi:hypothetical protein
VNGVKQPTVFCPFERLVMCFLPLDRRLRKALNI